MSLFTELTSNEQASLAGGTRYYVPRVTVTKSFNKVTGGAGGDATGGIAILDSKALLIKSDVTANTKGGAGGSASIS